MQTRVKKHPVGVLFLRLLDPHADKRFAKAHTRLTPGACRERGQTIPFRDCAGKPTYKAKSLFARNKQASRSPLREVCFFANLFCLFLPVWVHALDFAHRVML